MVKIAPSEEEDLRVNSLYGSMRKYKERKEKQTHGVCSPVCDSKLARR
jgi:hypothetical protein